MYFQGSGRTVLMPACRAGTGGWQVAAEVVRPRVHILLQVQHQVGRVELWGHLVGSHVLRGAPLPGGCYGATLRGVARGTVQPRHGRREVAFMCGRSRFLLDQVRRGLLLLTKVSEPNLFRDHALPFGPTYRIYSKIGRTLHEQCLHTSFSTTLRNSQSSRFMEEARRMAMHQ